MQATDTTFFTERTLPWPPAVVYQAFADAATLARWWGPDGFTNQFEVFEFYEGGRWQFVMHGPDGTAYPNESTFTLLHENQQIVIRHTCQPLFTLTITLIAQAAGTQVRWRQVFDDADTARAVARYVSQGNEQNLNRLTQVLASRDATK